MEVEIIETGAVTHGYVVDLVVNLTLTPALSRLRERGKIGALPFLISF
jgi:hypothetical protein